MIFQFITCILSQWRIIRVVQEMLIASVTIVDNFIPFRPAEVCWTCIVSLYKVFWQHATDTSAQLLKAKPIWLHIIVNYCYWHNVSLCFNVMYLWISTLSETVDFNIVTWNAISRCVSFPKKSYYTEGTFYYLLDFDTNPTGQPRQKHAETDCDCGHSWPY